MPRTTRARSLLIASLVLLLTLAACNPPTSGPGSSTTPGSSASAAVPVPAASGPSGVYPKTANPLPAAKVKTDASHAVTQRAGWRTETSITTKGRDGTSYTLTVPLGALLSDVDITMTPITSLSGFPISGGVGGVDLKPHGLVFQQPVTLTVTPKGGVPASTSASKVAALAADAGGADPHGYGLSKVEATAVTLWLNHFSLYYVGTFSPGDLEAILLSVPSATDGQTVQDLFNGADPKDVSMAWYNDVVNPALSAAEADLDLAADATRTAFGWIRQVALLGVEVDPALIQVTRQRIVSLAVRGYERATERCRTSHDIRQVGLILGFARQLALFGDGHLPDAINDVNDCLRLEFDVEETVQVRTDYMDDFIHKEAHGTWHMKAEQFVIDDWVTEEPDLPTPWVSTPEFQHKQSIKCPQGSGRTDDELNLTDSPEPKWHVNLSFNFNPNNDPTHDAGSAVQGTLELTPIESSTTETAEVTQVDCTASASGPTLHQAFWASRFVKFRAGESDTPTSISIPIEAGPGDPIIGEVHTTKTLPDIDDPSGGKMTETLDVRVVHNPQ